MDVVFSNLLSQLFQMSTCVCTHTYYLSYLHEYVTTVHVTLYCSYLYIDMDMCVLYVDTYIEIRHIHVVLTYNSSILWHSRVNIHPSMPLCKAVFGSMSPWYESIGESVLMVVPFAHIYSFLLCYCQY